MNQVQKSLLLILALGALLTTPAILLTAGVISFGGKAQPFIIVVLLLGVFSLPFLLPLQPSSPND